MEAPSPEGRRARQSSLRSPWSCSILTALTTFFAVVFLFFTMRSFASRQVGGNGCGVPMMSPTFIRMLEFDTEHTRFASKYNLFLYREEGVDPYTQDNIGVSLNTYVLLGMRFQIRMGSSILLTNFLRVSS